MDTKKLFAGALSALLLASLGSAALASEKTSGTRKQILQTKLEYSALYNELNTNPQYDMVCPKSRGMRLCMPRYLDKARQQALNKHCSMFWVAAPDGGMSIGDQRCDFWRDRAFVATANAQEEGFRENVQEILQRSAGLQALRLKLEALQTPR